MEQVFYNTSFLFGDNPLGLMDPPPDVSIGSWNLSSDSGFYYLLLIISVLVLLLVTSISNGRLGRLLDALSDSPVALETQGLNTSTLKVIVFCITACIASLAGALTGQLYNFAVGSYFPSFTSLELVAVVLIVAVGNPWYAVLAALGYGVVPGYISGNISTWLTLLFGVTAVAAAYSTRGAPMPQVVQRFLDRVGGRKPPAIPTPAEGTAEVPSASGVASGPAVRRAKAASDRDGLVVQELSVNFGGVRGSRPSQPGRTDGRDNGSRRSQRRRQDNIIQRFKRTRRTGRGPRLPSRSRRQSVGPSISSTERTG